MSELAAEKRTAAENFEALGICRQLAEAAVALKWKAPSPIQEQAIPHLLQGTHLVLQTAPPLDVSDALSYRQILRIACTMP